MTPTTRALVILILPCLSCLSLSGEAIHWLKNGQLEAGFSWDKGIRLSVLRAPGGVSLLRETDDSLHGLKTWVMAPLELMESRDMLSEEPAALEVVSDHRIRMRTLAPNAWGLVLEWEVELDATEPRLTIIHRIHNTAELHRQVGIWSVAALSPDTQIRVPFVRSKAVPRGYPNNVAVFPFTDLQDGRISSTEQFLQLDIREGREAGPVKLGLVQPEGRVQVRRGEWLLEFTAPYLPDALYPEGGSNVTLYTSPATSPTTMGEVEHMGPLEIVSPDGSIEFPVSIRLAR